MATARVATTIRRCWLFSVYRSGDPCGRHATMRSPLRCGRHASRNFATALLLVYRTIDIHASNVGIKRGVPLYRVFPLPLYRRSPGKNLAVVIHYMGMMLFPFFSL